MQEDTIILRSNNGATHAINVKIADTSETRKLGLQHLCADIVLEAGLLFIFPRSARHIFHMRNVRTDLDIAFISDKGWIVEVRTMHQNRYVKYTSHKPYMYALEVSGGRLHQLGLSEGLWRVTSLIERR